MVEKKDPKRITDVTIVTCPLPCATLLQLGRVFGFASPLHPGLILKTQNGKIYVAQKYKSGKNICSAAKSLEDAVSTVIKCVNQDTTGITWKYFDLIPLEQHSIDEVYAFCKSYSNEYSLLTCHCQHFALDLLKRLGITLFEAGRKAVDF